MMNTGEERLFLLKGQNANSEPILTNNPGSCILIIIAINID